MVMDAGPAMEAPPFNWRPILLISFCATIVAYSLANLFPYVGFMAAGFDGFSTDNAGFVAGYVASSFTFGRLISSYFWGWAADRFGCKPVLVWSMANLALWSMAFGMSNSLTWAITTRFCMGLTNGAMSTGRAMMPELAGKEHTVAAMSYLAGAKGVAYIFGPAIGGLLAQPAVHYPSIFASSSVFARYPYLLPNLIGAVLALITVPLVIVILPESKHADRGRRGSDQPSSGGNSTSTVLSPQLYKAVETEPTGKCLSDIGGGRVSTAEDAESPVGSPSALEYVGRPHMQSQQKSLASTNVDIVDSTGTNGSSGLRHNEHVEVHTAPLLSGAIGDGSNAYGSIIGNDANGVEGGDIADAGDTQNVHGGIFGKNGLLSIPHVPVLLVMAALHSAVIIGFEEAYPLWALSSYGVGGLEWNNVDIGKALVSTGIGLTIYQIFCYNWLVTRIGIVNMQMGASYAVMMLILTVPNMKYLSWDDSSLLAVSTVILTLMWACFSTIAVGMILASTSPVPPHVRGQLSGLYLMSQSLGRTIGPAAWATMYAWSVSTAPTGGALIPLVDYRFVFNISALLMGVVGVMVRRTLTTETMTIVVDGPPVVGGSKV